MYVLELTDDDMRTIHFVGGRYCWSDALARHCHAGTNRIPEFVAWEIKQAFEDDTDGGHSFFPMLDQHSELATKLFSFLESIV